VEYAADILGIGMCRRFVEHETKLTSRQLIRTVREAGLVVLKMRSAYFLSPFAAMVFGSVSKKLFEIEIRQRNPFGMLLYCLVEKPQASRKSI
jgi:hypothetical protein